MLNMDNVSSSSEEDYRLTSFRSVLLCKSKTMLTENTILDISTSIICIKSALPAILGNLLILLAIRKTSSIAPPSKVLLDSLAFTDLGVGLLVQPLYAVKTLSSCIHTKCITSLLFHLLSGHLSITSFFSMMLISLDRFLALHLKMRCRNVVTLKRALFAACSARAIDGSSVGIILHVEFQCVLHAHPVDNAWLLDSLIFGVYQNLPRRSTATEKFPKSHATGVLAQSPRPQGIEIPSVSEQHAACVLCTVNRVYSTVSCGGGARYVW